VHKKSGNHKKPAIRLQLKQS